jgi:LL-diaminopimelate aminotransferase
MEVGVELNSLSKPYNMTGWRLGMAMGNADIIAAMSKVKSNTDSGVFNAVQYAGITALEECDEYIEKQLGIYDRRRRMLVDALQSIGVKATLPRATLYVWARVPEGKTSAQFAEEVFDKAAVVVTAGSAYGPHGEGFIRCSLTIGDERLEEACRRLKTNFAD